MTTATEPHRARHAAPSRLPLPKLRAVRKPVPAFEVVLTDAERADRAEAEVERLRQALAEERQKVHALTLRAIDIDVVERERDHFAARAEELAERVEQLTVANRRLTAIQTGRLAQVVNRTVDHPDDQATQPIDVRELRVITLQQAHAARIPSGEETTLTIPIPIPIPIRFAEPA